MTKLEDLVPPRDLCRQIPPGAFDDSALIWMFDGFDWWVNVREFDDPYDEAFPAPTLPEIMEALPKHVEYRWYEGKFCPCHPKHDPVEFADKNPETAALKLWLELNKK